MVTFPEPILEDKSLPQLDVDLTSDYVDPAQK